MNLGMVTHAHLYFFLPEDMPMDERAELHRQLQIFVSAGNGKGIQHIGLSPFFAAAVPRYSTRFKGSRQKVFVTPEDAAKVIAQQDSLMMRTALTLMYSCGLSAIAMAGLHLHDIIRYKHGVLLYANKGLHFLSTEAKLVLDEWLAENSDRERVFYRLGSKLQPFNYLSTSLQLRTIAQKGVYT